MNKNKKNILLFCTSILLAFVYFRAYTLLFFSEDEVSFLRKLSGLTIHHYHYGMIILLIGVLVVLFLKRKSIGVVLTGLGMGVVFDSFVSRLFKSTTRAEELANYHNVFGLTILVFAIIILLAVIFYALGKYKKE